LIDDELIDQPDLDAPQHDFAARLTYGQDDHTRSPVPRGLVAQFIRLLRCIPVHILFILLFYHLQF
jgi:hypothetical protein